MIDREPFSLRAQPWWTDADQAELDTLTDTLTRLTHGRPWDDACTAALQEVLDFRDRRARLSKALWMRDQQNVADTDTIVAHYLAETRERLWPKEAAGEGRTNNRAEPVTAARAPTPTPTRIVYAPHVTAAALPSTVT